MKITRIKEIHEWVFSLLYSSSDLTRSRVLAVRDKNMPQANCTTQLVIIWHFSVYWILAELWSYFFLTEEGRKKVIRQTKKIVFLSLFDSRRNWKRSSLAFCPQISMASQHQGHDQNQVSWSEGGLGKIFQIQSFFRREWLYEEQRAEILWALWALKAKLLTGQGEPSPCVG